MTETVVDTDSGTGVEVVVDGTVVIVSTVADALSCANTAPRGEKTAATQMAISVLRENILKVMIFFIGKEMERCCEEGNCDFPLYMKERLGLYAEYGRGAQRLKYEMLKRLERQC